MNQTGLRTILNQELAVFFGKMSQYFDVRFNALEQKLDGKVGIIYTQLDGIAARLDNSAAEWAALTHQVN